MLPQYDTTASDEGLSLDERGCFTCEAEKKLEELDLEKAMLDCLYAKCTPCIPDCVMAELKKLGHKYCVALRIAKDPRFERLPCIFKGTYADECIVVDRVTQRKIANICRPI